MRLRSLFVCPCARCREARREEREPMPLAEALALIKAWEERGLATRALQATGKAAWLDAIRKLSAPDQPGPDDEDAEATGNAEPGLSLSDPL